MGPAFEPWKISKDEIVPIEHGEMLFAASAQPKTFFALPGADHLISDPEHVRQVAEIFSLWLRSLRDSRISPETGKTTVRNKTT